MMGDQSQAAAGKRSRREAIEAALRANLGVFLGGVEGIDDAVDAVLALDTGTERVRHLKTGGEYEVLGEAEVKIATRFTSPDGIGNGVLPNSAIIREGRAGYESDRLTVYRSIETGKLCCRFTDEFRDGRFVTIQASSIDTAEDERTCYMCSKPIGDRPFHTHPLEGEIHADCTSGEEGEGASR